MQALFSGYPVVSSSSSESIASRAPASSSYFEEWAREVEWEQAMGEKDGQRENLGDAGESRGLTCKMQTTPSPQPGF